MWCDVCVYECDVCMCMCVYMCVYVMCGVMCVCV